MKTVGQTFKNVVELASSGGGMGSDQLIVGAADLFVKFDVGCASKAAVLSVLMKNAADKELVISDVGSKQKRLFRRRPGKGKKYVGDILAALIFAAGRTLKAICARESFEDRADIIAQLAIGDARLSQNVAREHIKIKM